MTDDTEYVCKDCGSDLRKLIGAGGGIIFKGTGFYTTDYGNKMRAAQIEASTPRKERHSEVWKTMEHWEKKVVAHENKKSEAKKDN